ncbi:MAG: ferredoxin [Nanoarchaeota archaeon]|nr:ferredoxin [Nanoarchaeota archaeon]MBU1005867.1 ferredoxin [Nanoarchaeota archaeon]
MAKNKIEVTDACIACGACVAASNNKFELDGDRAKPVSAEVDDADLEDYKKGAEACPVSAIIIKGMN